MLVSALLLAALAVGQGEALVLRYPHEAGLTAVEVTWGEHTMPMARRGEEWIAVLGVDLDTEAGQHPAEVTFRYGDGRVREHREPVVVGKRDFPTTKLTVEPKYVELSPEDQARAAREATELNEIYATLTPEIYWTEPFLTPVDGVTGGRNFGHRRVFNGQARAPHSGADLRAAMHTPIHASNRGRVVLAKDLFFSGNAVFIDHGLGVYSAYLHLDRIDVQPGQMVERGEVIGLSGATGRVTGPHLHWGVRVLDARVDPFSLLSLGQ